MDITAAIANMQETILALDWVDRVYLEDQEPGTGPLITIVPSSIEEEFNFGSIKRMHSFLLTAYFVASDTTPGTVHQRCAEINNALIADRRRSQNALTTITATWTEATNEGRELITMTSETEIHLLENC